jgi:hypothetical protein
MNRNQRGAGSKASHREGGQPDGNVPNGTDPESHPAPDRFWANVFTWTGPGIENIFIDFEPARDQRRRRKLWKDEDPDGPGEP